MGTYTILELPVQVDNTVPSGTIKVSETTLNQLWARPASSMYMKYAGATDQGGTPVPDPDAARKPVAAWTPAPPKKK
jgi:hypothetical protein